MTLSGDIVNFKANIAKITIGNKVVFGSNVTIRGGIHSFNVAGMMIM
jgi:acetyltransferase-like isoleucine patch superfamily enzyme